MHYSPSRICTAIPRAFGISNKTNIKHRNNCKSCLVSLHECLVIFINRMTWESVCFGILCVCVCLFVTFKCSEIKSCAKAGNASLLHSRACWLDSTDTSQTSHRCTDGWQPLEIIAHYGQSTSKHRKNIGPGGLTKNCITDAGWFKLMKSQEQPWKYLDNPRRPTRDHEIPWKCLGKAWKPIKNCEEKNITSKNMV